MSDVVVQLTPDQARALTEEIRSEAQALWVRVLDAYEKGVHIVLGYDSWGHYWEIEFGQVRGRGEQLVRAGRVARALTQAGASVPSSELVARELTPVLRQAPEDLPDIWARALEATAGKPTARDIRTLVEPYRHARQTAGQRTAKSGHSKRARNKVARPLRDAYMGIDGAHAALDEALATSPPEERLNEWLSQAESTIHALTAIMQRLQRELQ